MRTHGTLTRWNEERGFGFIAPAQGNDELFVHVSSFPRDGERPGIGELVSFEVEVDGSGKRRAIRVLRPGSRTSRPRARRTESREPKRSPFAAVLGLLVIGAIGAYGYTTLISKHSTPPADSPAQAAQAAPAAIGQTFSCDGRTQCSQMTSCAEATYFLQHCPSTQMDGNGDGEPCERQWCNWAARQE